MDDDTLASTHLRVWHLIPWVVNATASPSAQQDVQAHLAVCEDCREELALQRRLQAAVASEDAPMASTAADAGLQGLWDRIDAEEAAMQTMAKPAVALPGSRWTRWLLAAVVVQAVGLTALIGMVWQQRQAAAYQTLSQAPTSPSTAVIRLVPSPSLRLAQLQGLLKAADLRIVDSNADGSILGLAPAHAGTPRLDDTLARLRADAGVLLAEPIVGAP